MAALHATVACAQRSTSAATSSGRRWGGGGRAPAATRRQAVLAVSKPHSSSQPFVDPNKFSEVKLEAAARTDSGPALFLKVLDGSGAVLPVYVDDGEYGSAVSAMKELTSSRPPSTYDLFSNSLRGLGVAVSHVCIVHACDADEAVGNPATPGEVVDDDALVGVVRYADLETGKPTTAVEASVSDAINLALRFANPIYVAKDVVDESAVDVQGGGWQAALLDQDEGAKRQSGPAQYQSPPETGPVVPPVWKPASSNQRDVPNDTSGWSEAAAKLPYREAAHGGAAGKGHGKASRRGARKRARRRMMPNATLRMGLALALSEERWDDARKIRAEIATHVNDLAGDEGADMGLSYRTLLEADMRQAAEEEKYGLAIRLREELRELDGDCNYDGI